MLVQHFVNTGQLVQGVRSTQKTHVTLTFDLDIQYASGGCQGTYMFVQNFIKLRAAVHELSTQKTILPSLPRAVTRKPS